MATSSGANDKLSHQPARQVQKATILANRRGQYRRSMQLLVLRGTGDPKLCPIRLSKTTTMYQYASQKDFSRIRLPKMRLLMLKDLKMCNRIAYRKGRGNQLLKLARRQLRSTQMMLVPVRNSTG